MANKIRDEIDRSCLSKRRYETGEDAQKSAAAKKKFSTYRCQFCNGWHLTTKGKAKLTKSQMRMVGAKEVADTPHWLPKDGGKVKLPEPVRAVTRLGDLLGG